jgi:hypothetical protein
MRKTQLSPGQRFGRLTTVEETTGRTKGACYWRCRCDCGNDTVTRASFLTWGMTASCGCIRKETTAARRFKHGHARAGMETPEFKIWMKARERCLNPKDAAYLSYGGRGIQMCEEWRLDFAAFLRDVGPRPSPKHSIDRINNDGHYEPGNVRWATQTEQNRNTRQVVWVEHEGRRMSLAEFAERVGVPRQALHIRMRHHKCSAHAALSMIREYCIDNRSKPHQPRN